jgi:hypothetical protein
MHIDRQGFEQGKIEGVFKVKEACLNCDTCKGICWTFYELNVVPSTILNEDKAPS